MGRPLQVTHGRGVICAVDYETQRSVYYMRYSMVAQKRRDHLLLAKCVLILLDFAHAALSSKASNVRGTLQISIGLQQALEGVVFCYRMMPYDAV